jgi:hypothetical protein
MNDAPFLLRERAPLHQEPSVIRDQLDVDLAGLLDLKLADQVTRVAHRERFRPSPAHC